MSTTTRLLVTCLLATLCGFGGAAAGFLVFGDSFTGTVGARGPAGPAGDRGIAGPPGADAGVDLSEFTALVRKVRAHDDTLVDHAQEIDAMAADLIDLNQPDFTSPLINRCLTPVRAVTSVSYSELTNSFWTDTRMVCAW